MNRREVLLGAAGLVALTVEGEAALTCDVCGAGGSVKRYKVMHVPQWGPEWVVDLCGHHARGVLSDIWSVLNRHWGLDVGKPDWDRLIK